jgi:AcrR family transcriptional regulator
MLYIKIQNSCGDDAPMPPKQKITKEMILEAAFQITREKGFENVNARSLAAVIRCSTQPIFSQYQSMMDLKKDFFKYLTDYYNEYALKRAKGEGKNFSWELALAYIAFAQNESNLFQVLFMSEIVGLNGFSDALGDENMEVAGVMSKNLGISLEAAKSLLLKNWIFMHGIASMIATKSIKLADGEAEKMLGEARAAFLEVTKRNEEKK